MYRLSQKAWFTPSIYKVDILTKPCFKQKACDRHSNKQNRQVTRGIANQRN